MRVLSRLFRRLFLQALHKAHRAGELRFYAQLDALRDATAFARHLAPAAQTEWVVYAKPPFGGPARVLNYLSRYTHRVATSNNRLLSMQDGKVAFLWKNYKDGAAMTPMTLKAEEFIRRFLLHVLPKGFQHIRSYGFLGNRYRGTNLALCRRLLGAADSITQESKENEDYRDRYERLTGNSLRDCPVCGRGHMVCIETFLAGSLPRTIAPDTS